MRRVDSGGERRAPGGGAEVRLVPVARPLEAFTRVKFVKNTFSCHVSYEQMT